MSEFKSEQIQFTSDEVSSLKDSEFKQYLYYLLNNSKEIELPEEYNKEFREEYLEGFRNYLELSLNNPPTNLSERQIFFMALVAYKYKTPHPLIYYDKHITNTLSDTYYWLYLAHTKHFYSVMEVEMYRRRITTSLDLVDLSTVEMKFLNETQDNIIKSSKLSAGYNDDSRFIDSKTNIAACPNVENFNINTNLNMPMETIFHYSEGLDSLINKILSGGGIIAGGFVNSLINPVYKAFKRDINALFPSSRNLPIPESKNTTKFLARRGFVHNLSAVDNVENKELLEHFHNMIAGNVEDIYLSRQNFYKDYLGQLFNLNLIKSNDIDIFVTGEDYLEKTRKIIDSLYFDKKFYLSRIHYTESSFSFSFANIIKVQIIKRSYTNLEEILGGFDLNPSRVALTLDEEGKWKFVAPQAYIDAVQYGVNVVVPCWQSETFNSRLSKYRKKGFDIYLPGKIINRFNVIDKIDLNSKGNLVELITYIGNPHKWNMRDLSDYESSSLNYLARVRGIITDLVGIDKRAPEIISGKRDPNMNDLVYMINQYFTKYAWSYRSFEEYNLIVKLLPTFWRTTNPSTQLTGSFNPTRLNYLSGEDKNSNDLLDSLKINLPSDNSVKELYHELTKRKDFPIVYFKIPSSEENLRPEPERDPNSDLDGPESEPEHDPNSDLD